jgi:hypothetical protein
VLLAAMVAFARRIPLVVVVVVVATHEARRAMGEESTYLSQRTSDGVTLGVADRGVLGSGQAGEKSNEGDLGEHVGWWWVYYWINAQARELNSEVGVGALTERVTGVMKG